MENEIQQQEKRQLIFADWKVSVDKAFVQATHDALTGLPNRSLFQDRLRVALSESKRRQEILAVLFIDLDKFKEVNDVLGHDVGDQVLTAVGVRFLQAMRSEEIIARLGGDEFAALIQHIKSPQEAEIVATRLFKALNQPFLLKGRSLKIRASIGISLYPFDGAEEAILLKCADSAMFRAKKKGGHGFEFFEKPKEPIREKEVKMMTNKKILIVDDDTDFQLILTSCLKKEGYSCISAISVEEALKQVSADVPDLVILDLGLSQASGLAFLQNLSKAVVAGEKIPPVLVVSGYNDPEIIEFTKTLGAARFLAKPVDTAQIIAAIRSYIQ